MSRSDKTVIIGVDIVGTQIRAGTVQLDGSLICEPVILDTRAMIW